MDKKLYEKALNVVITEKNASISNLQRKLRIGYNTASELLEIMEVSGIISPTNNSRKRTVLLSEVPDTAKTLSEKAQNPTWWQTTIVISFFIFFFYFFASCTNHIINAPEDKGSKYAFLCQNMALSKLKYPSKAVIKDLKWNWDESKQTFYVYGSYEAMNSLGAIIPNSFSCSYDKDFNLKQFIDE